MPIQPLVPMTTAEPGRAPRLPKFAPSSSFSIALEAAVSNYFRERGASVKANAAMVRKTLIILALTYGSYAVILAPGIPMLGRWLACVTMAFGFGGMGMAIGHDALHGAYSHRPWVNKVLGWSFDAIGANSYIWRYSHNIAHHTYTNIDGLDLDIDYDPLMRFAPSTPVRPAYRLQSIYAFGLYALAGLHWVFNKDFSYFQRKQMGPYTNLRHPFSAWAGFIGGRIVVFAYVIVIPALLLRPAWWQLAIGFLTVYVGTGLIMALVFQLAHSVEGPRTVALPSEGRLEDSFFAHQLATTADFGCDNRLLSWYVGGLNFQIEHHLFPQICSVHYPALRPIVKRIAAEHGLPHHEFPTMRAALRSHVAWLNRMGAPVS